jgi:YD repeat-containing protein
MKQLFLVSVFILHVLASNAQTNNLNPTFVSSAPPSPNVSSIQKFGNIPIGPSTGIPQVNVPIYHYENKSGNLNLSVSLDYHAGGIRVDEIASSIGLGWALNAGGMVSRAMQGIPDECIDGFLNTSYLDPETGNNPITDPSSKPFVKANNRQRDLQADVFSFNFNGRSGKFTYGKNGHILMIDDQKIKIDRTVSNIPVASSYDSMIVQFVITDENGIKYVFNAYEQTTIPTASFHKVFTSSWYLTKILSQSGRDSIILNYENVSIAQYICSASETAASDLFPNGSLYHNGYLNSYSTSSQAIDAKRLKSIIFPNGVNLQFVPNSAVRSDLPSDRLLNKIVITDSIHSPRGYILEQDYSLNARATLLRVYPFTGDNPEVRDVPYQFFYYSGLPDRLSNKQDHWGYPIIRPMSDPSERIPWEIFSNPIGGKYELPGVNRDTDSAGCKAGTLYKMIYPTGGRTEFEFEPNTAVDGWLNNNFSVIVNDPPYNSRVENFYLSLDQGATTHIDASFIFNGAPDGPTNFQLKIQPTSSSATSGGGALIRVEFFPPSGYSSGPLISVDFTNPLQTMGSTQNFSLSNLVKGNQYYIRYYFTNISYFYGNAQLTWQEKASQTQHTVQYSHVQPFVGGLRVKSIKDYDGISSDPVSEHDYEYTTETGQSSGVLASFPTYTYTTLYKGVPNVVISGGNAFYSSGSPLILLRQSSSINDIVYTNGSPVTYSRVVERITGNNTNNGKIERFFTTHPAGTSTPFPFTPPVNLSWMYGLMTKELFYDVNGQLIKKTENQYSTKVYPNYGTPDSINNFASYSIAPVMFNVPDDFTANENSTSVSVGSYPPIWFLYNDYLPYAGRSDLLSTTITYYDKNGQNLSQTVSNEYDPIYYYLKKKKYINSKNNEQSELYIYPADKVAAGQSVPYQEMVDRNIINPIVQTDWQLNGTKQRALITNYQKGWSGNTSLILPATMQTQFMTDAPETRVHYYAYDEKGNPQSGGQENGTKINYIWAYNKQYPVAEIKNADYNTIETVLGGSAAISSFSNQVNPSDAAVRNFLAPLRTDSRLKNTLIVTYTYAPIWGVTSQTDPTGKTTYYEYDGFGRLLRIKDLQGNIVKQFEYQYQASTRCGSNCYILPMTNLAGSNTLSYPVGVFNANGKLLDTASNQARFIAKWNADTANANRGTLSAGGDSMHFQLTLNAGKALPAITGCRYYKVDLSWNQFDGVRNINGCYVDFGDGAGVRLPPNPGDIINPLPANTIQQGTSSKYLVHTYSDTTTLKTLTFYHNDAEETQYLDNVNAPATSLSKVKNLRGNLPQHIKQFGSSSNQQASMSSVANVTNWASIHSINDFHLNTGDGGITTIQNLSYQQDFMAGNADLQSIQLARNNLACYFDATFKISRLKSDWNTWFKHLQFLSLTDAQWNREDLSGLKELNYFYIIPARPNYSNDPTNNAEIPIPQGVVDSIFNQIASGSGQSVSGGVLYISSGGSGRSASSDAAVSTLLAKGWTLYLDGQQLH